MSRSTPAQRFPIALAVATFLLSAIVAAATPDRDARRAVAVRVALERDRAPDLVRATVFGSRVLDVTKLDLTSIRLDPAGAVAPEPDGTLIGRLADVDRDGFQDLIVVIAARHTAGPARLTAYDFGATVYEGRAVLGR